jgi:Co/Zn/Cd efflux system component
LLPLWFLFHYQWRSNNLPLWNDDDHRSSHPTISLRLSAAKSPPRLAVQHFLKNKRIPVRKAQLSAFRNIAGQNGDYRMGVTEQHDRVAEVLHAKRLEYFTIIWNLLEGIVSLIAGLFSGSVSLVGFGVDSFIEVASGAIVLWRMAVDHNIARREHNEDLALKLVGFSFIGLSGSLIFPAVMRFHDQKASQHSIPGIVIAALSLIVMPLLSRAKRRVAAQLKSSAMKADARQTDFCAYLSAIVLTGLLLNLAFGWWWADPVAAILMAAIIANEGVNASLGKRCCD